MSKYIDADLLRKEIEKNKQMIDGLFTEGDDSVYDGEDDAYNRVLRIIDSLQQEQPSLPSNLDEAAREIVIKMHPCLKDCTILGDRLTRGQLMALVKAGAEWMAKQGHTQEEIVEDKTLELGYSTLSGIDPIINLSDSFKPGDKVIVQVRKK